MREMGVCYLWVDSVCIMKEMPLEAEGEMSFYTRRLDDAPAAKRAWISRRTSFLGD